MICPHCNKAIQYTVSDEAIARAKQLRDEGYSLRDIEVLLRNEGFKASFASLSRRLRCLKKRGKEEK